jgi:beta-galactosidase
MLGSVFSFHFSLFIFSVEAHEISRPMNPRVVSIGKELPRGDVVSCDSREEALAGSYHSSKYLQTLEGWTVNDRGDAVVYSTRYKIPFEWLEREEFLYLGKVSGSFEVVVNGELAGYSQTGSTPSEFNVTRVSREGNNDLDIVIYKESVARVLENSREPVSPPQIMGEVYVLSQPRMRVRDIFVDARMEGTAGIMELGVIMKSHRLNDSDYRVYYELIDPTGKTLTEGYKDATLDMRREDTVRFFARVPRIIPWSHEEPRLYTLLVKTRHEGRFKEYLTFQIGFRGLDFRDGLIRLNGTPLKITMREFTPTSDMEQMRSSIKQLQSEGINTLKLQGAPPTHRFYELCNELGVYLCNSADIDTHLSGSSRRVGGNPSNQPEWEGAYLDRVMSMYHTSKNSPSVVMFSLAEESANGYNLYESYLALKKVEKQRPIVYPEGGEWNNDRVDFDAMNALDYTVVSETQAVVTVVNFDKGEFRVHNTRQFTPLFGEAVYRIMAGKKSLAKGSIPIEVLPEGDADFVIPIADVVTDKQVTVEIEIQTPRPVNRYTPPTVPKERKLWFIESSATKPDKIVVGQSSFTIDSPNKD